MQRWQNEDEIAELQSELRQIKNSFPNFVKFLEDYCGFWAPVNSADPHDIAYSGGKRDVILTLKTISREDLLPKVIIEQLFKE